MIRVLPARALLPAAYMAGLFALSSIPQRELNRLGISAFLWDLGHVPLFVGLTWVTFWALRGPMVSRALVASLICTLFAFSDELHQTFVPGRVFSWSDVGADLIGVGVGIVIGLWTGRALPSGRGKPAV